MNDFSENKKGGFFSKKLIFYFIIIACGYLAFQYWQGQENANQKQKLSVKTDAENKEIFEVSDEYKNEDLDLSDLTINAMREKGAEFIYQMLLKNQLQIESLKSDVSELKGEVLKYKNHEKIAKLILTYVKLREKFFAGEVYDREFKSFEMLCLKDKNLEKLSFELKGKLQQLKTGSEISKDFSTLIPQLIAIKNYGDGEDFISKLRRSISLLITVRRTDKLHGDDFDAVIFQSENLLKEKKYHEALNLLNSLELKYQATLQNFKAELQNRIEVEKTDHEITNYLENLAN